MAVSCTCSESALNARRYARPRWPPTTAARKRPCMPDVLDTGPVYNRCLPFVTSPDYDKDLLRHLILDFRQMTRFADEPWVFTRGEGVRVQDAEGKWYLDGLS